ncbi:LOW QUALITY PROTEIN: hypothetical protein HID58_055747, partial [Brassica napus]
LRRFHHIFSPSSFFVSSSHRRPKPTNLPTPTTSSLWIFHYKKERTLDWGFDKGTEWQHDRESRYMPAEKMDLRAIGSTWRSKSKIEAKDFCRGAHVHEATVEEICGSWSVEEIYVGSKQVRTKENIKSFHQEHLKNAELELLLRARTFDGSSRWRNENGRPCNIEMIDRSSKGF